MLTDKLLSCTSCVDPSWWFSGWSQVFGFWFEPNRRWKHRRTVSAVFGNRFGRLIVLYVFYRMM